MDCACFVRKILHVVAIKSLQTANWIDNYTIFLRAATRSHLKMDTFEK